MKSVNLLLFKFLIAILLASTTISCNKSDGAVSERHEIAQIISTAGSIQDSLGSKSCISYVDSALQGYQLSTLELYKIFTFKNNIYFNYQHNIAKATIYADSILLLLKNEPKLSTNQRLYFAYLLKADVSYELQRYGQAYEYYAKAKELIENGVDRCAETELDFRMGTKCFKEHRYLESARLFLDLYKESGLCTSDFTFILRRQESLSTAAEAFNNCGLFDSSKYCSKIALSELDTLTALYPNRNASIEEARGVSFDNLGNSYRSLEAYDAAEYYYLTGISLLEKINRNHTQLLQTLLHLASLYVDQKDYLKTSKVLKKYDQIVHISSNKFSYSDSIRLACEYSETHWKYSFNMGDLKTAITHLKRYHQLKEAEWLTNTTMLNNETQLGIHNAYDDLKIAGLKRDAEMKKTRNTTYLLSIILLGVAILLIVAYFRAYKRTQKVKQLENEKMLYESKLVEGKLKDKLTLNQLNLIGLIENTDDFLWSVDRDYKYLAFNQSYARYVWKITGKEPEIGIKDLISINNPTSFVRMEIGYRAAMEGNAYYTVEKGNSINGYIPDIEVRIAPIKNANGEVVGVSCYRRDITRLLKMQNELKQKNDNLKIIAWTQSHKLRGPLATMKGIVDFLNQTNLDDYHKKQMSMHLKEKLDEMDNVIHEIVRLAEDNGLNRSEIKSEDDIK